MASAVGFPIVRKMFGTYPVVCWSMVGGAAYLYKAYSIAGYQRVIYEKDNFARANELAKF
jgi:hypothetical protein